MNGTTPALEPPAVPVAAAGDQPDGASRDANFAALVTRHARFLYRVAFSLLKDHQDAEDAVQETFLKLYRGTAWLAIDDEQAFLARSVWRVGLNRLGSASAKAMRHAQDVTAMELPSPARTPEQDALAVSERELMQRMIEALPEDLRRPLVLSAIEGMRSSQVAHILGIPDATVRTRVLRARNELRRRFLAAAPKLNPREAQP